MMSVNLIQYRGIVGMFNNRCFASSSLNYSYFSKKYHNDDTFTLAIGLIILAFWHLMNDLSNWKFISRFLSDLNVICNFSRKILYLSMIGVYIHHIWLSLTIIRLSGDTEENLVLNATQTNHFLFVTGFLTVLPHTAMLKYPFWKLIFHPIISM